jgi:hypothetical protein
VRRTLVTAVAASLLTAAVLSLQADSHNVPGYHNRVHAIHWAFCGKQTRRTCDLGWQAFRVAKCESGWSLAVHASNGGRYLGMFQFGSYARSTYGFAWNPWAQSSAAYRYWRAAGGWGPWQCKP